MVDQTLKWGQQNLFEIENFQSNNVNGFFLLFLWTQNSAHIIYLLSVF